MQISLINEHLFCKYFVRLYVDNATKALLLMDVFILVLLIFIKTCLYSAMMYFQTAPSLIVETADEALVAAEKLGYPILAR